jgi:hypothetical protein
MADKLTSADIAEITRQSDAISKNLRDNFTNLKNKTNEVIDYLAAVSIGTTNAETTAARPYHTNLKARLDAITTGKPNYRGTITSLVTESTPNAMTVEIATDIGQAGGISINWAAATTGTITAPSVNPRIDIVVANSDNTITIVTGSEAATPVIPTVSSTQIALARIDLTTSTTAITNSEITNYNGYVWSQIGEIIAIHPDTLAAYLPNSYHYSPCDGVELLDTTYIATTNDTKVPDLTDDRFLMGDTAYGFGNGGHVHQWMYNNGGISGEEYTIIDRDKSNGEFTTGETQHRYISPDVGQPTGTGQVYVGFSVAMSDEKGYTTGALSDAGNLYEEKPKYFSTKYYIRIR